MFLKFDPYKVWYSIYYSKLVDCIFFEIIMQHICFVKGRWTCGSRETLKYMQSFRKYPRFSLTATLCELIEVMLSCFYDWSEMSPVSFIIITAKIRFTCTQQYSYLICTQYTWFVPNILIWLKKLKYIQVWDLYRISSQIKQDHNIYLHQL